MVKRVVVIASGPTEQRVLPVLLANEQNTQIEVLIPPRNGALTVDAALALIRSTIYGDPKESPNKYVVLLDVDGKMPDQVLSPFKDNIPDRLESHVQGLVHFSYAQWHLEAWFFADASGLRGYFDGSSLGSVDPTNPDNIQNPKNHLKNLLRELRLYTARVSEEIAGFLDDDTIASRSPSYRNFRDAIRNGEASLDHP